MSERPIRVLFVCTGNAARSQMAEAILRRDGGAEFEVFSAGVSPRPVHPLAIRALADIGLDISGAQSKDVAPFVGQRFDYVITLCDRARQNCPFFPGAHELIHWGLDDPSEAAGPDDEQLIVFRRVMVEIAGRVKAFMLQARRTRGDTATVAAHGAGT